MRGFKIAVPVVLVALMAATAFAADTKMSKMSSGSSAHNWTFGINGGGNFPTGDYKNEANTGYSFGAQADWWLNSQWGFGVDGAYHSNNGSDDFNTTTAVPLGGTGATGKFHTFQYGVHAIYMIPVQGSSIYPYIQAGTGGYSLSAKIDGGTTSVPDVSTTAYGFNGGAGVDFHATDVVSLGVGGTYNYATKNGTSTNWFGVNGRVTFKIPMNK